MNRSIHRQARLDPDGARSKRGYSYSCSETPTAKPMLLWETTLSQAARWHSWEMAEEGYFSHDTHPSNGNLFGGATGTWDRIRKWTDAGSGARGSSEIIAAGYADVLAAMRGESHTLPIWPHARVCCLQHTASVPHLPEPVLDAPALCPQFTRMVQLAWALQRALRQLDARGARILLQGVCLDQDRIEQRMGCGFGCGCDAPVYGRSLTFTLQTCARRSRMCSPMKSSASACCAK